MLQLPKTDPSEFCIAFVKRELIDCKKSKIWMTRWPIMERMLERADELKTVFEEVVERFGYADKTDNPKLWLTLEQIWMSFDYSKGDVSQARQDYKELNQLKERITDLSLELADALRRQSDIFESSGFRRENFQTAGDLLHQASEGNYLYENYLGPELERLRYQYDLKYWPDRADLIDAIGTFEYGQSQLAHVELPREVLEGRATDIKDFVLAFDRAFNDPANDLPKAFRFSNSSMADIINVVLDLPPEKLATADAVRIVRNRYEKKFDAAK